MAEENAKLKGQVEKLTANGKIALEKLQEKMKESTEGTLASLFQTTSTDNKTPRGLCGVDALSFRNRHRRTAKVGLT